MGKEGEENEQRNFSFISTWVRLENTFDVQNIYNF